MDFEIRLAEKLDSVGLKLPPAPEPKGLYRPILLSGSQAFLSGHLPFAPDGTLMTGRVADTISPEDANLAAFYAGLSILATLRKELGDLNRVVRLVKTVGFVACTPDFDAQPSVINGCSQLFADVFGEAAGIAARSAVGVAALPLEACVEVEAIFEVNP